MGVSQVRSATRVEQVAACMLQLEASLRRGALSRDWDPLARLAARQATASRAASEALPPVAVPPPAPPAPGEVHPSTPQADASAPGTPNTLAVETGTPFITFLVSPRWLSFCFTRTYKSSIV